MVGWNSDDYDDHLTQGQWMSEGCKEHARNVGADRPEQEYILTPFDTWERNPNYTGKPGPHPEDLDAMYLEEKSSTG